MNAWQLIRSGPAEVSSAQEQEEPGAMNSLHLRQGRSSDLDRAGSSLWGAEQSTRSETDPDYAK